MPQQVSISASGEITVAPIGPVGPPGNQGIRGPQGVQGGIASASGLLSGIPLASSVSAGYLYNATNESGGTLYVSTGSVWVVVARATAISAGEELGSAALSTSSTGIAITTANVPFRIPALTTSSFTMPARPVRVETSSFAVTGGLTSPLTILRIVYTKDAWVTTNVVDNRLMTAPVGGIEGTPPLNGMLPPVGALSLAPGDTVQVGLAFERTDTGQTLVVLKAVGSGVNPWLKVLVG